MRIRGAVLLSLLLTFPVAAKRRTVGEPFFLHPPPPVDVFTASQPSEVRTYHLSLDLVVDFEARQLRGSATHTILNFTNATKFIVDTRSLSIQSVTIDGQPATYTLGASGRGGRALTIDITPSTRIVRIDYSTPPGASNDAGYRWLTARQTTGGVEPLFYTFSQPDKARGWLPVQDTPGVKMTYDARITVPPQLLALMSARNNPRVTNPGGVYHFTMNRPVPAYLIALAVGRLEFRATDERTGFYVEPELVDDASWDLQYLPDMLDAAERVLGPYPYERYDALLLPPSFSAGGMENPLLNFFNVAGMVDGNRESPPLPRGVAAHEIAHSWAGDMVTCGTWSDTWLNEGFATYYDKRILEELGQKDWAEYAYVLDRRIFSDYVTRINETTLAQTKLHRVFTASDTPSIFNPTTYQKGSLFLKTIEDLSGRDSFDLFIREYFERHAHGWASSDTFESTLRDTLLRERPALDEQLRVDDWIHGIGLPANVTAPTRSALEDRLTAAATAFRNGTPASALDIAGWTSRDGVLFLSKIQDLIPLRMAELDAAFGFSLQKTPPTTWLVHVAKRSYAPGMPALERFLEFGGWNVAAIYSALAETLSGKTRAREIYNRVRDRYGPDLQAYLDQLLRFQTPAAA